MAKRKDRYYVGISIISIGIIFLVIALFNIFISVSNTFVFTTEPVISEVSKWIQALGWTGIWLSVGGILLGIGSIIKD